MIMLNYQTNMNSKDKAFLQKYFVKESSIVISLENFGATEFSIMDRLVLRV